MKRSAGRSDQPGREADRRAGQFQPELPDLPREVLISDDEEAPALLPATRRNGKLLPNFIAIRNGDDKHLDIVQQGNEHVLGARFADADFFVREDLKQPLEAFRPELAGLIFQAKLGSMLDKSERMLKLAEAIARMLDWTKAQRDHGFSVRRFWPRPTW